MPGVIERADAADRAVNILIELAGALGADRPDFDLSLKGCMEALSVDVTGSALVGAASHLALDWFEIRVPAAEHPMHVLGAIGLLFLAVYIGRRRLLHRWHGDPPERCPRPGLFWPTAVAVTLPVVAITPFLPGAFLAHTTGARLLCAIAARVLAASAVVARYQRRASIAR